MRIIPGRNCSTHLKSPARFTVWSILSGLGPVLGLCLPSFRPLGTQLMSYINAS